MIGFVRLLVFGFIGLSVIYIAIWFYSRSVRREKLEKRWDAEHGPDGDRTARDTYIEEGMVAYQNSIRPKLIGLVYVIPALLIIGVLVFTNWN